MPLIALEWASFIWGTFTTTCFCPVSPLTLKINHYGVGIPIFLTSVSLLRGPLLIFLEWKEMDIQKNIRKGSPCGTPYLWLSIRINNTLSSNCMPTVSLCKKINREWKILRSGPSKSGVQSFCCLSALGVLSEKFTANLPWNITQIWEASGRYLNV